MASSDSRQDESGIVLLMGPTAAGKTALGIELVQRFPLEIVSVDSAMVYRGMDIGTGKPTAPELALAPHHLIDVCEADEPYSAARFCADASRAIARIHADGKVPLLLGGTGLYFRALREGLSVLPTADAEIRRRIEQRAASEGWDALHAALARVDPIAAGRIHPNDPQRIQRALEVYESSGRSMTDLLRERPKEGRAHRVLASLKLMPGDRERLHQRIARRFAQMLELGLVAEVDALRACPRLHADLPSMRAVGYRQVWEHLDGASDYPLMIERSLAATRQLARRQLTWLRPEHGASALDCFSPRLLEDACRSVQKALSLVENAKPSS